jgi:hypothetical protein
MRKQVDTSELDREIAEAERRQVELDGKIFRNVGIAESDDNAIHVRALRAERKRLIAAAAEPEARAAPVTPRALRPPGRIFPTAVDQVAKLKAEMQAEAEATGVLPHHQEFERLFQKYSEANPVGRVEDELHQFIGDPSLQGHTAYTGGVHCGSLKYLAALECNIQTLGEFLRNRRVEIEGRVKAIEDSDLNAKLQAALERIEKLERRPTIIDCGVWCDGRFASGSLVTFKGSAFIAQCDTSAKPEESRDWRLAVKRGRDGKDAVPR